MRYDFVNGSCFNVVDNIVAGSRDEMTIGKYVYSILCTAQHMLLKLSIYKVFTLSANSLQRPSYFSSLSHALTLFLIISRSFVKILPEV